MNRCPAVLMLVSFLAIVVSSEGALAQSPLLRIKVHCKIGFIDTSGRVVIEPK